MPLSVKAFSKKPARAARTIPAEMIKKAVAGIRSRAKAIVDAQGGSVARD